MAQAVRKPQAQTPLPCDDVTAKEDTQARKVVSVWEGERSGAIVPHLTLIGSPHG